MQIARFFCISIFIILFSVTSVLAQEDSTIMPSREIEEIVVTGSQIKGAKITGSLNVSVITGIDIEAIASTSGDDLLEHIAEQGQNYFTEAEDAWRRKCISW